jgi:subtilisin family serine protease
MMSKTSMLILFFCFSLVDTFAQPANWQHKDYQRDSVFGISTEKAYDLLKGKTSTTVIVGIIDTGIDTLHEDLKPLIWQDKKTGLRGWNYIAAETGQEDVTRLVGDKKDFYDSLSYTLVTETYRAGYRKYKKLEPALDAKIRAMNSLVEELETIQKVTNHIVQSFGKSNPTAEDFQNYPAAESEKPLIKNILKRLKLYSDWKSFKYNEIDHILELARYHLDHGLNIKNMEKDTAFGNADITPDKLGPVHESNVGGAYHGTHVAGIIGAVRGNGIGMDGVADNVRILMLKENGTLREMRDEALARAIRFAVDHGVKVLNLSFGKPYTWNKKLVDDAVKYAMKHDVLLVHAAGNTGSNIDLEEHYPNPVYLDNAGVAHAWLEVGASDSKGNPADFSNYGQKDVDVFAPGVQIYSTLPYNQYQAWNGTSMATPMVVGLGALIREYYPKLTAVQVKDIIIKSVVNRDILKDKCVSGGIVNAYNALKLAASY